MAKASKGGVGRHPAGQQNGMALPQQTQQPQRRFRTRQLLLFAFFFVLGRLSEFRFGLYMKLDQYIGYSVVVTSDSATALAALPTNAPNASAAAADTATDTAAAQSTTDTTTAATRNEPSKHIRTTLHSNGAAQPKSQPQQQQQTTERPEPNTSSRSSKNEAANSMSGGGGSSRSTKGMQNASPQPSVVRPQPRQHFPVTRGTAATATTTAIVTDTTTNSMSATAKASLFFLISSPRCGASWVMSQFLNANEAICASGKLPLDVLQATTSSSSSEGQSDCVTLVWFKERIAELVENSATTATNNATTPPLPKRCESSHDSSNDALRPHLPRLCQAIVKLQGDYSAEAVTRVYIDNFVHSPLMEASNVAVDESETAALSCQSVCPAGTRVRGLRIVTADWIPNILPSLAVPRPPNSSTLPSSTTTDTVDAVASVPQKVIRLTRHNLFERYMSNVVPSATNIWWIASAPDKALQLERFAALNYTVDVDDMLSHFKKFASYETMNDEWVEREHRGETLWVDFAQVRDAPDETHAALMAFLGLDDKEAIDSGSTASALVQQQRQRSLESLHKPGSLSMFNHQALLESVANRDVVREALCANDFGHFIGAHDCQPMHHLVFSSSKTSLHTPTSRRGLEVSIVTPDKELDANSPTGGLCSKFNAARSALETMPPQSLVFLSEDDTGSVNHHIQSQPEYYTLLASTRRGFAKLVRDQPNAVVVSASSKCCSPALSNVEPGDLFDAQGSRTATRTCRGMECDKTHGESKSELWMKLMKDLAASKAPESKSTSFYLDGSFVAGTASAMIQFIDDLKAESWEDDRAILTDYMYRHPDKVIVDYDHELFGLRFEGVASKINLACNAELDMSVRTASPLFLHSDRHRNCVATGETKAIPIWEESGIEIQPILNHVDRLFVDDKSVDGIDRHFDKEILYIVDRHGVWGTEAVRDIFRVLPSEDLLTWAYEEMVRPSNNTAGSHRWRALQNSLQGAGFPYWAWYGDWKHCNYRNMGNESIPIFTTCAEVTCNFSFPTPSYMHVIDSQPETTNWYSAFHQYDRDYPWSSKIRKVVWRGALSENVPTKVFDSQRWRLCKLVHELSNETERDMFDVGLTNIPTFLTSQMEIDATMVGGVKEVLGAMNEFQRYTAILDMDGNSWSSRFRTMLCYNSVAIKVEPAYVDYFFSSLIPWRHYIPVKNDLSDLLETVAFALDPANDGLIQEIITSANHWCAERSTHKGLVYDMLDTWESYIQMLDRGDPQWQQKWDRRKQALLAPTSNITLVRVK